MTTALVQRSVDFYGDELIVIHQDDIGYTPVKPVCELLGLDWEAQRRRIQEDDVMADAHKIIPVYLNGADQAYSMLCLPLDHLHGWLFGVNGKLIRPSLRERLVLYKRECYRALARAFGASGDGAVPVARVVALEARVAVLEGRGRHQLVTVQARTTGAILDCIEITGDEHDRLTGSEIAAQLVARGIVVAATQRGAEVVLAELLRRLGARRIRPSLHGTASRRRTWVGVRMVVDTHVTEA